jgi:hypothetical protein
MIYVMAAWIVASAVVIAVMMVAGGEPKKPGDKGRT